MISESVRKKYKTTIGIECHVQLKTATKLFSAVSNDARKASPNTLISHICLGMPGALPVLNQKAVDLAVKMAFALNTKPEPYSIFERKHYFYPDLPKGYQISQLSQPIIKGGHITISSSSKPIQINRVQIEEDAGKNTHPAGKDYSLVDLNRAGTPLLEIVSEADMHSAEQAKQYVRELYLLVKYADISDADLYHGNMRFDVNVSVSQNLKLGIRTETKNLNSFKTVEKAAQYEIDRQIEQLEKGQKIVQETRGWDEAKQKTLSQRGKEEAHDYRYMPEPDLPPIELNVKYVEDIKKSMLMMPSELRVKFENIGLNKSAVETLIAIPSNALLINDIMSRFGKTHAKRIANWFVNSLDTESEETIEASLKPIDPASTIQLSKMVETSEVSSTAAKQIWSYLLKGGDDPLKIAKEQNLIQVSDETEISKLVEKVIKENYQAAQDVKNGLAKAIGFLVGQVMKQSHGKANPQIVQDMIRQKLN